MWLILTILLLVIAAIIAYLHRTGVFYKVQIRTGPPSLDTICLAYKFFKGSYSDIYLAFKELNSTVKLTSTIQPIGIYYDDPDVVVKGKQRYAIGIILNKSDLSVNNELEELMIKNNYNVVWITKINHAVLTEFPSKTFLSLIWSVRTVYPKLKEFIKVMF